jgi:acyl-CoA reductase-like NAD-dependent aldehyde dehydrogenase
VTTTELPTAPVSNTDRLFIDGDWVKPSSDAMIDVIDSHTENVYFRVAEAQAADIDRAVGAAREAFDNGPWPRMTHAQRADLIRAFADGVEARNDANLEIFPRESGMIKAYAVNDAPDAANRLRYYAGLADTYPFEEPAMPTAGGAFGLLNREPVGVVGAIVPWNGPLFLSTSKIAPALIAGCTIVLKMASDAPGEGYILAEAAKEAGLPRGVLNILTADRTVSELLVSDPRVDKIAFTGSTAAGRRIASICGDRVARCTLELGGKSAAIILDDMDLATAAPQLIGDEIFLTGQVCSSLTRVIVGKSRHDELVDTLASGFAAVKVGDPYDPESQMGPLAGARQRERVEGYLARGVAEGARLVTGGGRPKHLDRGYYVEPTLFADVNNRSTIAQEEIFGPVLVVIPAENEDHAVELANDSIYGLNASVYTPDVDRARAVARRLRTGTVGHNACRTDFGVCFGGFKQSGLGREGGREGMAAYLETKFTILEGYPSGYSPA